MSCSTHTQSTERRSCNLLFFQLLYHGLQEQSTDFLKQSTFSKPQSSKRNYKHLGRSESLYTEIWHQSSSGQVFKKTDAIVTRDKKFKMLFQFKRSRRSWKLTIKETCNTSSNLSKKGARISLYTNTVQHCMWHSNCNSHSTAQRH